MHEGSPIIGNSQVIKSLHAFIDKAAENDDLNVLLLGETGVGKDLAARTIHERSKRKGNRFVKLNCSSFHSGMLESELFGHKKGAFTGAEFERIGLIEYASNGTLFLDEVGDTSFSFQGKLLSVIEDKEIRRLGENENRGINTRFVFATNTRIGESIEKKIFRKDLYYRICILEMEIPPLRERKDDIPFLIEYFIKMEAESKGTKISLSGKEIDKLLNYDYPGNIRELKTLIKRKAISNNLDIAHDEAKYRDKKRDYSVENILRVIIDSDGNKTKAAKRLGMSRVQLYRIINKVPNKAID